MVEQFCIDVRYAAKMSRVCNTKKTQTCQFDWPIHSASLHLHSYTKYGPQNQKSVI